MRRTGQAALEFLTTYGWALLIILVMIGTISYFGVLNPSKLLPSRCLSSSEFVCEDYLIDGKNEMVFLQFSQSLGKTVYLESAGCEYNGVKTDADMFVADEPIISGEPWSPRKDAELQCDFSGFSLSGLRGEKVKVFYNITYVLSPAGFPHTVEGELFSEVQ